MDALAKEASSIVEVLKMRAERQADVAAFVVLSSSGEVEASYSYAEVDARARQVASCLLDRGPKGSRALLLYPTGIDFVTAFFGCLYAGWVAVPCALPRPRFRETALPALAADARANVFLTTRKLLPTVSQTLVAPDAQREGIATDGLLGGAGEVSALPASGELAFLQYTSGSTSLPRGAMISHANIMANTEALVAAGDVWQGGCLLGWLPLFHDMGLMSMVLLPLSAGKTSVLMPPAAFLQSPLAWLRAIQHFEATFSGGPNFCYEHCIKKVSDAQAEQLDLSRWKVAFNGAEPIRSSTLDRFVEKFSRSGFQRSAFFTCYGMAEATLMLTAIGRRCAPTVLAARRAELMRGELSCTEVTAADAQQLVSSGKPWLDHELCIVDPESHDSLEDGRVGEIWVRGPSVSRGYYGREATNPSTFHVFTRDASPRGPFMRTGDLGLVYQGQLYVTGRMKDLLICRGRNLHPNDLEQSVEALDPALRTSCGAAFALDGDDSEGVALAYELERGAARRVDLQALMKSMRATVLEKHGVSVLAIDILKTGQMPRTSSGKPQRQRCRALFLDNKLATLASWRAKRGEELPTATAAPDQSASGLAASEILERLSSEMARALGVPGERIDPRATFAASGLDSVQLVAVLSQLSERLGCPIPASLPYDFPSPLLLAEALAGQHSTQESSSSVLARQLEPGSPIAVVGIGCRFPGGETAEAFWSLLEAARHAVKPVPPDRWDIDAYYSPDLERDETMNTRFGGFLDGIAEFDAEFFGVSRREAAGIDPQQRLLLEVAWEALEDACIAPHTLAGSETGVFVGISSCEFYKCLRRTPARAGTGVANSVSANRLSYFLDLRGPSMTIDTACSSSLVAVHSAVQSLRSGECECALVGGVNVILSPEATIAFSQAGMMASDGLCRSFDAAASGYVRGEGCGLVVLKRLEDALEAGDRIRAVIRGSAISQDGRSNGLTAPSGLAQQKVVRKALIDGGVAPEHVDVVEAHGSGTPLGDVVEATALAEVLRDSKRRDRRFGLGSVKANIGHLEAAAGIAGLIKATMMLEKGMIPAHPHFTRLNPKLRDVAGAFEIATLTAPAKLRFAGVSSFGFGGTNAHVVLEAPHSVSSTTPRAQSAGAQRTCHLFCLSARNHRALRELAAEYAAHLGRQPLAIEDICLSAASGRMHFSARLGLVAESTRDLRDQLGAFASSEDVVDMGVAEGTVPSQVAILFPGRGLAGAEQAKQLCLADATFREAFEEVVGLAPDRGFEALFAVQIALWRMWRSWGLSPHVLWSHGSGHRAATVAAGARTLLQALQESPEPGADDGWRRHVLGESTAVAGDPGDSDRARVELALASDGDVWRGVLLQAARLYVAGVQFDWESSLFAGGGRRVGLPTYRFQRQRCWPEASEIANFAKEAGR